MQTTWFDRQRMRCAQCLDYAFFVLGAILFMISAGLAVNAQIKGPALQRTLQPCCQIVRVSPQGIVIGRINNNGKTFMFVVKNTALLSSLKPGKGIYANLINRQVSLDGRNACCQMGGFGSWVRYGRVTAVTGNQIAVARPTRQTVGVRDVSVTQGNSTPTSMLVLPSMQPSTQGSGGFQQVLQRPFNPFTTPPPHRGQTIWLDQQMGMAQYTTFPMQAQVWDEPSNGDHMQTQITVSYGNSSGQINGTTHVYTGRAAYGFKGTVRIVFLDDSGNALYTTPAQSWTVNGTAEAAIPGNGSNDVTNGWTQPVSLDVLNQVRAVSIVHSAQDLAFEQILAFAQRVYQCAAAVYQAYQQSSGSTDGQRTGDGQAPSGGSQDGSSQGPSILQACFNTDSGGSSQDGSQFARNTLPYEPETKDSEWVAQTIF